MTRRWTYRAAAAATAAAIGLVATGTVLSPASADAPVRTGWWNALAAGGQGVPARDVPAGGMRVAVASSETLAFGAVQYAMPRDASGTLTLPITTMTGSPSHLINTLLACPTTDASWKAGDDQDMATAPHYSCDTRQFVGRIASDGNSVSFNVDGSADVSDGVLSLAIVAQHEMTIPAVGTDPGTGTDLTPPFAVDLDKPSSTSLVIEGGGTVGPSGPPPPPPLPSGASGGSGASTPTVPGSGVPAIGGSTAVGSTPDTGQSPVVAGSQPAAPATTGSMPTAAVRTATPNEDRRNLLLVMLILLLFAILYTQNAATRAPRALAGPRARADAGAAGDTAALVAAGTVASAPRGLGRFAKPRSGGPRPLI